MIYRLHFVFVQMVFLQNCEKQTGPDGRQHVLLGGGNRLIVQEKEWNSEMLHKCE